MVVNRIGVLSCGKVCGDLYALLGLIFGVMGFIGGVITSALYNLVARWVGGLEVQMQ